MYQTVGHQAISCYAEAMQIPLFRRHIRGTARLQSKDYEVTPDDEVEDLFDLLVEIQGSVKFDAIAAGAILSQYQTLRVLNICKRLNLQVKKYITFDYYCCAFVLSVSNLSLRYIVGSDNNFELTYVVLVGTDIFMAEKSKRTSTGNDPV